MADLSSFDLYAAIEIVRVVADACAEAGGFAQQGAACIGRLLGADLTTLSTCDLDCGRRAVVSDHPGAISPQACSVFDRFLRDHPLVRAHGRNPMARTQRIEDVVADEAFRRTPLFNEYYRAIGIDHVMAIPIHVDGCMLVSFVLIPSCVQ